MDGHPQLCEQRTAKSDTSIITYLTGSVFSHAEGRGLNHIP